MCGVKACLRPSTIKRARLRWTHELGPGGSSAGVLTTESGVTFTGDAMGNFLALRTSDGKTLWHAGTGGHIDTSPISFEVDGRQYIVEWQRHGDVRLGTSGNGRERTNSSAPAGR